MRVWIAASLAVLSACKPAPAPKPGAPTPRLERVELPEAAHAVLRSRMHRHIEDAGGLLESVLYLDYERVAELAERIAQEPQLAKVTDDGDTHLLNTHLPASFFVHQTALAERAKALQEAAQSNDHARTSKAFGALTETCVNCHAAYLHEKK